MVVKPYIPVTNRDPRRMRFAYTCSAQFAQFPYRYHLKWDKHFAKRWFFTLPLSCLICHILFTPLRNPAYLAKRKDDVRKMRIKNY